MKRKKKKEKEKEVTTSDNKMLFLQHVSCIFWFMHVHVAI